MMHEFKMYSPCCKWYLEIHTDCPSVRFLIEKLFCPFIVLQRPLQNDLEFLSVTITRKDSGYALTGRGKTYHIKDLSGVGFYLYAVIDKLVESNLEEKYCVFHGGVIAKGNQAYGVIAPTMTGKSTLITYLSCKGYEYLADDYIVVNSKTKSIAPMPLPVSLRTDRVLTTMLQSVYSVSGFNELRGENIFLVGLGKQQNEKRCREYKFNKVFFIARAESDHVCEMGKGEVYKELLFNLKNSLHVEREIGLLGKWVKDVAGFRLTYNRLEYVSEVIERI